ncbi:YceI family protein [Flavobacterium cellulosilyticum]|uniref:YceI family protein n=1 Tax=Flavobacterium cellulosilyticum TaxID=2541731 RepID=A0A4R5CFY8_9FLAO|nr:YceI family protein [Flavobacterium cellulosilyticum]TDD97340.1 YceI family protein [Flavobacterium cellulosilyticum]
MKRILLLSVILFLSCFYTFSQNKKITRTGTVQFEASVPSFEEVNAKNESVTCILNIKTGEIASLVLMKGFRFKIALMEEHFNENYLESDKYPKATFNGKIQDFNWNTIGTSVQEFMMNGKLGLHGKSKEINTPVFLRKIGNDLEIITKFSLNYDDFNIEIPNILTKKISKIVNVKADFLVK